MPSYAAFIGHQPHISLAELAARAPGFVSTQIIGNAVVLFTTTEPLGNDFLDSLGGTVTLAEELPQQKNATLEAIPQILAQELMKKTGKVTWSLRTLGIAPGEIKTLYRHCKDLLKKKGKPSRYVGNEHKPAASILLHDAGLLDGKGGCELTMIKTNTEAKKGEKDVLWVGITRSAQDIEGYAARDMKKPVRDTTVGLLPPKLAQVMINFGSWLARGKDELTVLDPFCGTGVIPMECLLRGFPVLASDVSEKAVTGCAKNLEWIRKEYEIKKSAVQSAVWKQDATKPFDPKARKELANVGVIVTETSLGPPLDKRPTLKQVQKLRAGNEDLQARFLENMAASFPTAPIVCTWPVWYASTTPVLLERIWKTVEKLGYSPALPPFIEPMTIQTADGPEKRMSLIYRRADQFVGREIVMLKPRKR